jgi:excisionase family DNA binding protein
MIPSEKMLAIKEFAGPLGVGRDTVRRWIENGSVKAVELPKAGGKGRNKTFRIPESELRRLAEDRRLIG